MQEIATGVSRTGVRAGAAFEQVLPVWRELGPQAAYFFQTPEWIELLAGRLEGELSWALAAAGGRAAAASVLLRSVRSAGGISLRVLSRPRFGEAQRLYADGLIDGEAFGGRVREVADASGPWDVMWLVGLRARSPWRALAQARMVRPEPGRGAGVLESDLAFSERWQGVSKNMRDSIRKARRRIEERGGAEIVVTAGGEIGEAFERFVQLEASGWKAGQGGALAQTPLERALWRDYLPIAPDAQIRELRIDGALAAAQITVSTARTLFLPRIAYDENLAELSPSNVLMAELLESCCGDPAIDRIDCMEWQPWHPRWGMVREPTYTLVAFNSATIRGNAARGARRVWELFNRAAVSPATARPTRRGGEHVDRWRARPRMTR